VSTVSEQPTRRAQSPADRGRHTQAAIDAAARTVIARKGIRACKEAMVREPALQFRDEAFAQYCAEMCAIPTFLITERASGAPDDRTRIDTVANIFYRASYYREVHPR